VNQKGLENKTFATKSDKQRQNNMELSLTKKNRK